MGHKQVSETMQTVYGLDTNKSSTIMKKVNSGIQPLGSLIVKKNIATERVLGGPSPRLNLIKK